MWQKCLARHLRLGCTRPGGFLLGGIAHAASPMLGTAGRHVARTLRQRCGEAHMVRD